MLLSFDILYFCIIKDDHSDNSMDLIDFFDILNKIPKKKIVPRNKTANNIIARSLVDVRTGLLSSI